MNPSLMHPCRPPPQVGVLGDVLDNAANVVAKGRLGPGQMVMADLASGTFKENTEVGCQPLSRQMRCLNAQPSSRKGEEYERSCCKAWQPPRMDTLGKCGRATAS